VQDAKRTFWILCEQEIKIVVEYDGQWDVLPFPRERTLSIPLDEARECILEGNRLTSVEASMRISYACDWSVHQQQGESGARTRKQRRIARGVRCGNERHQRHHQCGCSAHT
jgi:hypothetical protein